MKFYTFPILGDSPRDGRILGVNGKHEKGVDFWDPKRANKS